MSAQDVAGEIAAFVEGWTQDPLAAKSSFVAWHEFLASQAGVEIGFKARPNVSYSLRARHINQAGRELFVMVDVVDDDPAERWLSVCFYADLVSDPEGLGDVVPQGLAGEDACCFNLDEDNSHLREYIAARLAEAVQAAGR